MKKPTAAKPPRKRYVSPRLVRYGDVAQLTQTRFIGPLKDNGKILKSRTR